MSTLRRNRNVPMYELLDVPYNYLGAEVAKESKQTTVGGQQSGWFYPNTFPDNSDAVIYFTSLFLREFASTMCLFILTSRLGGDLFIAGPLVTLYINIVFRRPMNNPFVTTLACASSGEWKRANVSGYPGYDHAKTKSWEMILYWILLVIAQLLGAVCAAEIRTQSEDLLGHEFIKNAAWGAGQLKLMANVTDSSTCWNKDDPLLGAAVNGAVEIPIRLYRDSDSTMLLGNSCLSSLQWRWWFFEDLSSVLFLIVGYIHIWQWLRWDDTERANPTPREERYWEKIVTFSTASASLGIMNTIAFPTAHAGLHTSLFLHRYQVLNDDKHVTSNEFNEPLIRAFGGMCGCLFAVVYEWIVAWLSSVDKNKEDSASQAGRLLHKMVYVSPVPDPVKDQAGVDTARA
jgi:hypothetical protein